MDIELGQEGAAERAVRDVVRGAEHSGRDINQYGNADAQFATRRKSILPLLIKYVGGDRRRQNLD